MKTLMKNFLMTLTMMLITSTAIADTFARTTASNLNVREAPSGNKITGLSQGTVVGIMETEEDWARVMYLINNNPEDPQIGWVSSQYLQVLKTDSSADNTQVANSQL